MKNLKKWLVVMLSAVMAFSTFGLVSCGDDTENSSSLDSISSETDNSSSEENSVDPEELGTFYTLQEAYDNKCITVTDLRIISEEIGRDIGDVELEVVNAVKALYYRELCEMTRPNGEKQFPNANINDIQNIVFYGEYGESYCFRIWHPYAEYATVMEEEMVEGVLFIYSGPRYVIWKR